MPMAARAHHFALVLLARLDGSQLDGHIALLARLALALLLLRGRGITALLRGRGRCDLDAALARALEGLGAPAGGDKPVVASNRIGVGIG